MTQQEFRMAMRNKARLAKGLVNLLQDDTQQMCVDTEDFDLFSLAEALKEAKRTSQNLLDTIDELDRDLRLVLENTALSNSREKHRVL